MSQINPELPRARNCVPFWVTSVFAATLLCDYASPMDDTSSVTLTRDCEATLIPAGTAMALPAGTVVQITQDLGGSYTLRTDHGLFRVASKDADALGLASPTPPVSSPAPANSGSLNEQTVWETLKTCYDPEIPVNIVDLGLVYDLAIEPAPAGQSRVAVKMTLTAPGCGMGPAIASDAQQKLLSLPGVADATVEIVWDPPWHHSRISPAGRATLGLD
jgi:probable FeS assembly SUF system protein SufT